MDFPIHLGESIVNFMGVRSEFDFLFHFSMKFLQANRIASDGKPRSAASHLPIKGPPGLNELTKSS